MSNLQPNCCLKFDFQKVDQHAGGKWLIHDTKRSNDNQLQSLKLPCRISGSLHVSGSRVIIRVDDNLAHGTFPIFEVYNYILH